jgi:FixJ family two-component response regulator
MSFSRPLIAVVDDDAAVCKALARLIGLSNLDVVTFASGEVFLAWMAARQPDCQSGTPLS